MSKPFPYRDYEAAQQLLIEQWAAQVELLYRTAVQESARLAGSLPPIPNRPFRFSDYPQSTERLRSILGTLTGNLQVLIARSTSQAWTNAGAKTDALLTYLTQEGLLTPALITEAMMSRNLSAFRAFQTRKTAGLTLSNRVFRYEKQLRRDLETGLGLGISRGQSAASLAVDMMQYLQNPGLMAVDAAKIDNPRYRSYFQNRVDQQHPGRGVYKSAYKNAERLTRSEINSAYRTADYERYQSLPFVVGIRVQRSQRITTCPICPSLAGTYPKEFLFQGWHAQCRCFAVPILATRDELRKLTEQTLNGESTAGFTSENAVTEPHAGWSDWLERNRARLGAAPVKPLFVSQNSRYATK